MGSKKCCVIDCANFRYPWRVEGPSPSYHKFPVRNDQHAAWVQFAARGRDWLPGCTSFICSNHFRPEDFVDGHCNDLYRRLRTNVIPTKRPLNPNRNIPEKRLSPENETVPGKPALPLRDIARMQKVLQATVQYTDGPSQGGGFDSVNDKLSPSPSVSDSESEDDDMSVEEKERPAMEIRFTYSILRSGLSLVTLPAEWKTFMDDDDFVMFFRIDKSSYEITHAVNVGADLVPKIRIHNLLYSGGEFGQIPLENFWCLRELLLSLSCATICPGLESNLDGGCALVFKGGAALCAACKARKRATDQQARKNAAKESKDDSKARKCTRRKKRQLEQSTDMENLDLVISNDEVGLPKDGIPFEENKELIPLETPKKRKRSAKTTWRFRKNLENSLPVDPWFGIPEGLPELNTVPLEGSGNACDNVMDSSGFSTPVPIEDVGIASDTQLNESDYATQENIKINKKTCQLCGFVADHRKIGMTAHIRRVHPECAAQWTVECMYCGRKFPCELSLKIHEKATHKDGVATVVDPAAIEAAVEHMKTTGRFTFYCAACHLHYISQAVFDLHQFHHSTPDSLNDRSERDCPACDFHAPSFSELVPHMSKHSLRHKDKKPCLICGRFFAKMRQHIRHSHPDEMRRIEADWGEQCAECGEKFKWKRMLGYHKRTVHDGFQCYYCARRYCNKTKEFGDHVLEHKVDGVFPCPLCDKKYPVYPLLAGHYRAMHDITRVQYCTICRKALSGGSKQASTHMERCTLGKLRPRAFQRGKHHEMEAAVRAQFKGVAKGQRLPCDQCGKLLASAGSMSRHIHWTHIGDLKEQFEKDREEKRKQGTYVYRWRGYVKPRARMALEEFPFRCDECQLGYIKEISLIKHRDTLHPEKCVDTS